MIRSLIALVGVAAGSALAADPGAFDWPQWRGPDRTGLSKETALLKDWPKEGPKQLWKIDGLGHGYSTPSISAGRIYLVGTKETEEYLICLEEKSGARVWETKIGREMGDKTTTGRGPHQRSIRAAYVEVRMGTVCGDRQGTIKWQKTSRKTSEDKWLMG